MRKNEKAVFMNLCMICDGDGNVLVQDRTKPDWPGITFPGGHVERGESLTDSAIREVYEETGLTVSELQLCGVEDWVDKGVRNVIFLYKTKKFSGNLVSSDEGEVFWLPLDKLPDVKLSNAMKNKLELFANEKLSENFFEKKNGKWIETLK